MVVSPEQPRWEDFETCASWSIDVDLKDVTGHWLADFHDSGYSVAALDEVQAEELCGRVGPMTELELLAEIRRRRALERRDRRWRRLQRLPAHLTHLLAGTTGIGLAVVPITGCRRRGRGRGT